MRSDRRFENHNWTFVAGGVPGFFVEIQRGTPSRMIVRAPYGRDGNVVMCFFPLRDL